MNATVGALLVEAVSHLRDVPEPRREAQILLAYTLGVTRAWLAAHALDQADAAAAATFHELVLRRRAGEPVAYLVGSREFYGLIFRVTPDVLIPRADTETLIEVALEKIGQGPADVLDLGTGSGCVAIALAHERPAARVTAVDVSPGALGVARDNARANAVEVQFVQGSWFAGLAGRRFDIIVSNPPYIAQDDAHLRQGDLRFEPAIALSAGQDGLAALRLIVSGAPAQLREGGWLFFEHGYEQARASRDLLLNAAFCDLISRCDINGVPRVAGGRLLTSESRNH